MTEIILFDGICNFCESSVQFIIRRDPEGFFKFASLQGEIGQKLLSQYGIKNDFKSIVVISDGQYHLKSNAALQICKRLDRGWKLLSFLRIIPLPIRDYFYDILAKNRYKWFGKKDSCMLPSPEIRARFLD